jgi:GT2 family glycosyltransferase
MDPSDLTIVVPSKDRAASLRRLLESLRQQIDERTDRPALIVVDDGSNPPIEFPADQRPLVTDVLRTGGVGPGAARNRGWRQARTRWVAFLDDDVVVQPGWLDALVRAIASDSELVIVEGRVVSEEVDPLYERSITRDSGGWGLTCNVAYRRDALTKVGGFDEAFPHAHCEDLDLWIRMDRQGPGTFVEDMVVEHSKRDFGYRDAWRRGRWGPSEVRLVKRHPGFLHSPRWLPASVWPVYGALGEWRGTFLREARGRGLRRVVRALGLAAAQVFGATSTVLARHKLR